MAIELLVSQDAIYHRAHHDLESVFFILIYLCTNLSGPGTVRPLSELQDIPSLTIASWFNPAASLQRLGADKISSMILFEQRILSYFSPYFEDLKPCVVKFFKAIYPDLSLLVSPRNASHDDIIKILNDTLQQLPVDEPFTLPVRQWKHV